MFKALLDLLVSMSSAVYGIEIFKKIMLCIACRIQSISCLVTDRKLLLEDLSHDGQVLPLA